MRDEIIRFLLSRRGRESLDSIASEKITPESHLTLANRLRQSLSPEEAAAVLETTLLRQKAAQKFSRAGEMLFSRDGLEQATGEIVASHRAGRFAGAGFSLVADLGCGIGGDAIALAARAGVVAVDISRIHLLMTKANAVAYEVGDSIWPVQADLTQMSPLNVEAFFFDPARRTTSSPQEPPSRRLHSVKDYRPPLGLADIWRAVVPHGAIKVSPAIDYGEIPKDAEIEFTSLGGEVKEGVLWFGDLREGVARRATLLPGEHTLIASDTPVMVDVSSPQDYLFEPNGAIIRAHLVGELAVQLNAALIDPEIAYLTAAVPQPTPFARCYQIEDYFPFQLKRLRQYCRERGIGQVTIKKRGSPLDPDDLRQALRLSGSRHVVLFLTHASGQPVVLIGQPWAGTSGD